MASESSAGFHHQQQGILFKSGGATSSSSSGSGGGEFMSAGNYSYVHGGGSLNLSGPRGGLLFSSRNSMDSCLTSVPGLKHNTGFAVEWSMEEQYKLEEGLTKFRGRPRGKFKATRGLRQGDALPPFLFNLVVDGMGRLIERARVSSVISGLVVGKEKVEITHLQFADDTILFLKANEENLKGTTRVPKAFSGMSGLRMNVEKSALIGINVDQNIIDSWASAVGCAKEEWPIKYLGVPLGGNPLKVSFWEPVITKVCKKLAGWKKSFLSKGGRLTLIQSVLDAIPTYYLSLFRMPVGIANIIEKKMRNFLWEGFGDSRRTHLVDWESIIKPKVKGRLGVGNLVLRNKTLLGKWWWRYPKEREALWHKVIHSKYGEHDNKWDARLAERTTFRSPWKFISKVFSLFSASIKVKVGKGNKVRFWEDAWAEEQPFCQLYPSLYRISKMHSKPISAFYSAGMGNGYLDMGSWNFHFGRNLKDTEAKDMCSLIETLDGMSLDMEKEDAKIWNLEPHGNFSCQSFFLSFFPEPSCSYFKLIWNSPCPRKVQFFSWLLIKDRVLNNEKVQRRFPTMCLSPNWCVLCKNESESSDHTFVHCPFSLSLWNRLLALLKVSWAAPQNFGGVLLGNLGSGVSKKATSFWRVMSHELIWSIWLERNSRIIEEREEHSEEVWEKVKSRTTAWICDHKDFKGKFMSDLRRDISIALL